MIWHIPEKLNLNYHRCDNLNLVFEDNCTFQLNSRIICHVCVYIFIYIYTRARAHAVSLLNLIATMECYTKCSEILKINLKFLFRIYILTGRRKRWSTERNTERSTHKRRNKPGRTYSLLLLIRMLTKLCNLQHTFGQPGSSSLGQQHAEGIPSRAWYRT